MDFLGNVNVFHGHVQRGRAVLGGLESPAGAVVGGLVLGVFLNLIGQYVGFATAELRLPIAFAVLLIVLLLKPNGLFGRKQVRRV